MIVQQPPVNRSSGSLQRSSRSVVVIGSGFGGLAAAIRLQAAGFDVTIVEARAATGGRAYQLVDQGFTFDMGPSLITEPDLIADLWSLAGGNMSDDIDLRPLSPYYRIFFQDGQFLDYGGGLDQDETAIASFNADDVAGYRAFMRQTARIYNRAFADLAEQPFDRLKTFLEVTPELVRLGAHRSVYHSVARYFSDERLRAAFSFHPLFIGGNPFRASAIYSIIPYLERKGGVHFAMGGMYSVVTGLTSLFERLGGRLLLNEPVERINVRNGAVYGITTSHGRNVAADIVVANSDVTLAHTRLLPAKYRSKITDLNFGRYRHSMSCFLLYLGLNRQYDRLLHHSIVMPRNYKRSVSEVFNGHSIPEDIALYLHAPTKSDPSLAPSGAESLYVLVPTPNLKNAAIDWRQAGPEFRKRIVHFLEHEFGLPGFEKSIIVEHQFTPADFQTELRSLHGSAFGIEPTLLQSAWFRPHNRSRAVRGLYFAGAGTHPGAGIPGVLLSAKITSGLVEADFPVPAAQKIKISRDSAAETARLRAS